MTAPIEACGIEVLPTSTIPSVPCWCARPVGTRLVVGHRSACSYQLASTAIMIRTFRWWDRSSSSQWVISMIGPADVFDDDTGRAGTAEQTPHGCRRLTLAWRRWC